MNHPSNMGDFYSCENLPKGYGREIDMTFMGTMTAYCWITVVMICYNHPLTYRFLINRNYGSIEFNHRRMSMPIWCELEWPTSPTMTYCSRNVCFTILKLVVQINHARLDCQRVWTSWLGLTIEQCSKPLLMSNGIILSNISDIGEDHYSVWEILLSNQTRDDRWYWSNWSKVVWFYMAFHPTNPNAHINDLGSTFKWFEGSSWGYPTGYPMVSIFPIKQLL
jgi:hypothetical protein